MSRPKGKRTAGTGKQRSETRVALSLATARRMLPLVSRVVQDIQARWNRLTELEAEQLDLDHRRRGLSWPERARRYQVADDLAAAHRQLQEGVGELEQLAVELVDPVGGEAAFPTVINGRRGYFVWKMGDADLTWWCYAHDSTRHAIPANWRREP